jgi:hypothetical protein
MRNSRKKLFVLSSFTVVLLSTICIVHGAAADSVSQCTFVVTPEAGSVEGILDLIVQVYLYILRAVVKFVCGGLQAFGFSC